MVSKLLAGSSLVLAASALCTYVVATSAERRYPPIGRMVDADGVKLHVLERGQGVPVVFLHGASGNLRDWTASVFDAVTTKHRAIAVDRPGHGWSERGGGNAHDPREQARRLRAALQGLGVRRPVLVGHSWAGTVVLAYALAFPEEVRGILFLAGVSHPWPGGIGRRHAAGALPVVGPLIAHTLLGPLYLAASKAGVEGVFAPDRPPEDYRNKAAVALYARPRCYQATSADLANLKPIVREMEPLYRGIQTPVIVLTGDQDGVIFTHLHSPPLAEKLPNGELRVLKGVGHMPHHARPGEVLKAIDELAARN